MPCPHSKKIKRSAIIREICLFKKFTRQDSRNPYPILNQKHALPLGRHLLSDLPVCSLEVLNLENKNDLSNQYTNYLYAMYMTHYWCITPTLTELPNRSKNKEQNPRDRIREQDNFDVCEKGFHCPHLSNYYSPLQTTLITPSPPDATPPLFIIDKPKKNTGRSKSKGNDKLQSPQSREKFNEQDSRSNSRVHASESDNENTAETTKSTCTATNLTDLFTTNHIRIELNETAESPPKGSPLLPPLKKTYHETPWENELELTIPDTHQFCKDYPDLTIDLSFYHSLSDDTSDLQGDPEDTRVTDLKKTYHENPWANEFECTTSHTHQYCNDYPDLTSDYPFHSFDDDTSELQGAATEASDTDPLRQIRPISLTLFPILTQELLQIRYQQHRGPSSILSRESRRLHLRDSRSGVWTHPAAKKNVLNDDV